MATETIPMSSHLRFPPELWSITTQNFRHRKSPDDLTYLWTAVRHVSRQFKAEIEDIFLTEHLPKTWLHVNVNVANTLNNSPTGLNVFAFNFKLKYEKLHSRHPGRAVFSLRSENNTRDRPSPDILVCRRKTFKRLRDEAGTGRLDEADKSVAGSRIRLSESPIGMFVVQVRGSVGDCALPALNIHNSRHELSFEWRDLFNRFFGERKVVTTVLHGAPIGQVPSPLRYHVPAQQGSASSTTLTNRLNPSLHALAQLDCHTNHRHMQVSHEGNARIQRLSNPIQAWTDMMEGEFGQAKATIRRCQLRRQAD